MRHLAPAKSNCRPYLVAGGEPTSRSLHAIIVIMVIGPRAKLDFLYLNRDLFLFRLVSTFFLLVKKLSVIDYLANRWFCVWGNFNEIDSSISRDLDRIAGIHHTQSLAIFGYNPYRWNPDPLVRAVKRLAKTRPVSISTKSSCDKDLPKINYDLRDFAI